MHFPRHLPQHRSRPMRKKTGKSDPLNRARPTQKRPQQAPDPAFHTAPPPETPKNPPRNSKRPPRGAQKAPRRHQNPKKRRKGPDEQFTPTANPPRGRRCGVSLRIHVRTAAKRLGSPTGRVCDARAQPRYVEEGQLQNIAFLYIAKQPPLIPPPGPPPSRRPVSTYNVKT